MNDPRNRLGHQSLPGGSGTQSVSHDYLRGYSHGVADVVNRVAGSASETGASPAAPAGSRYQNNESATWGIQAVGAAASHATGEGIKIAVLDTGLDQTNPDFQGRNITAQSFVPGETAHDGNGHGTHCIGTALGSFLYNGTRRYGVSGAADIYAGKVLNDAGSGVDGGILAGINWAIQSGCQVISMSLGSRVHPGDPYSVTYENVAQRALAAGSLIVAAAGNDSQRPSYIAPVSRPANCPSIMAVAAVDESLGIAYFSNGGINPDGGEVNIAGPGVDVFSTWLMPMRYNTISGTSMATPHVAGVAGMYAQQDDKARGQKLWDVLAGTASDIYLPPRDLGNGLVQAPE